MALTEVKVNYDTLLGLWKNLVDIAYRDNDNNISSRSETSDACSAINDTLGTKLACYHPHKLSGFVQNVKTLLERMGSNSVANCTPGNGPGKTTSVDYFCDITKYSAILFLNDSGYRLLSEGLVQKNTATMIVRKPKFAQYGKNVQL